jgi:nitrogen-specific signal transduction histidine kinase
MKRISRGEWRYTLLLLPLLVLAALASATTVSFVESLFLELELNRAVQRLQSNLAFEQSKLAEVADYASSVGDLSPSRADAYLDRILRAEQFEKLHIDAIAVTAPDGSLLGLRFTPGHVNESGLETQEEYLSFTNIATTLSEETRTWVGFARVPDGPVLLALSRVVAEGEPEPGSHFLALIRPLDDALVARVQSAFPAFLGVATPETVKDPETLLAPIHDLAGRQIGAFVFHMDRRAVDSAMGGVRLTIYALTMGFLFLVGALGLWTIRFGAEIEGLRRVGRFVDEMDYLPDGLLAVDKKGRITGINPSARAMAGRPPEKHDGVRDLFPALTDKDVTRLSDTRRPREVEKPLRSMYGKRTWRFRSQPSEDMNLILISDVTDEKAQEMRRRQITTLQMIGRVARGVAHDFNNILCAISGHASLLGMPESLSENDRISLQAINEEAERGASLAAHLLQLSRARKEDEPADRLDEHVDKAGGLLRVGLASAWEVITDHDRDFPIVPLSPIQIEQAVLNLGLLAADELESPGIVRIEARKPSAHKSLAEVSEDYGAVVLISARPVDAPEEEGEVLSEVAQTTGEEAGVIQSVVRTMLEEVGGQLDVLLRPDGHHTYRLCMPTFGGERKGAPLRVPDELATYMGHWKVFVALPDDEEAAGLVKHLESMGTAVESATDIVGALSKVEREEPFTAMVFDKDLLGAEAEADGLLRAIIKLQPSAGIVVLCKNTDTVPSSLTGDVVFEAKHAAADGIVEAMIRAKQLVAQRTHAD